MSSCGVCNQSVKDQPRVQPDGTCSHCGQRLEMENQSKSIKKDK